MQQMFFIADLIACSTCFGHHYAHHQELESIIELVAACGLWCLVFKLSVWCGAEGCLSMNVRGKVWFIAFFLSPFGGIPYCSPRTVIHISTLLTENTSSLLKYKRFTLDTRANRGLMHTDLFINTPSHRLCRIILIVCGNLKMATAGRNM
jgi:hypothetical protein